MRAAAQRRLRLDRAPGRERAELAAQPALERQELASIYVARGLTPDLAARVAEQLKAHDALGAHARDELGISTAGTARPVQASLTSAASFAAGSALPLLTALVVPAPLVVPILAAASVVMLAALGALAARVGRAPVPRASIRVAVLGALAMGVTAGIGRLFGAVV
jgi:vacuolar iron transporter family protein